MSPSPSQATQAAPTRNALRSVSDSRRGHRTAAADETVAGVDIEQLERNIDALDSEILDAVRRRAELSALIGRAREAAGAPRFAHSREMDVLHHFTELGSDGHTLAMLLLRLGRHKLAS